MAQVRLSSRRGLVMGTDDETQRPDIPDHSLFYLETMILLAAMKIVGARRVLEFGTHLGSTTVNLALNLPADGYILTLDLVRVQRFKEWRSFPRDVQAKIVAMGEVDSTTFFDERRAPKAFDFIWVDGNADRFPDTVTAFKLLDPDKLSCIGWHDYAGPGGANTTEVIDRLVSEGRRIYHIEDSRVCLYFNRPIDL